MLVDHTNVEIILQYQCSIQATNNSQNIWLTYNHTRNSWYRAQSIEEINDSPPSTSKPIIESSYYPGVGQTMANANIFYKCYSDGRGPMVPIDIIISDSPTKQYLKERAVSFARV